MIFAKLFAPTQNPAEPLYAAIVAAARQQKFYARWHVPDTIDGRFDTLLLHLCLVIERLQKEEPALCQNLVDHFCQDMDGNLRELGAGDLTVAKKVRRMAEAFQGRHEAYVAARDNASMAQALRRNVYAGNESIDTQDLTHYALQARQSLAKQAPQDLSAGRLQFI
jgi:cytochrome b pre-mRNA-processing protein 3